MNRREKILIIIKEALPALLKIQDISDSETKGCFYPNIKTDADYCNARWQEGVLTIAWALKNNLIKNRAEAINRINSGINFLFKLQNKNGSFPEYTKKDVSFAASAFISLALAKTFNILYESGEENAISKEWMEGLKKCLMWLKKEDEIVYYNQESAAGAALILADRFFQEENFKHYGEEKIEKVIEKQKGYYPEKKGFDLGYSSLTLEHLGFIYLEGHMQETIIKSAEKYNEFILSNDVTKLKNTRNTKWAILDGFEIFSNKTRNGKEALKKILGFDINLDHLEDNLNLCTDLYRLCFAYEHVTLMPDYNIKLKRFNPKDYKGRNIKLLNPFRRIGLHRIRRFLTMTKVF